MFGLDKHTSIFLIWAFLFQIILIAHFTLRKFKTEFALNYGWIVYALSIVAVAVSIYLIIGGKNWVFWIGGFIYLIWAIYGYTVEYSMVIQWRNPINWRVFGPYITLYLSTVMFYWWPTGIIKREYWIAYSILFIISTILNVISH